MSSPCSKSFSRAVRHTSKGSQMARFAKICRNRGHRRYVRQNIMTIDKIGIPARFRNGYWAWIID